MTTQPKPQAKQQTETVCLHSDKDGKKADVEKEQVLAWVRERNPQTMELKMGCKFLSNNGFEYLIIGDRRNGRYTAIRDGSVYLLQREFFEQGEILGSDMGLQELIYAIKKHWRESSKVIPRKKEVEKIYHICMTFNCLESLLNQKPEFYQSLLPLINER